MCKALFSQVSQWVFDLDNTLYPPETPLFSQIEPRMTAYVQNALGVTKEQANHLRVHYWKTYGTTLAGLMREHDVDPAPYLHEVHQIDFSVLTADAELARGIRALPGRKIVYTNGTRTYAEQVLSKLGLAGIFDASYGIEQAGFIPKPKRAAFEKIFAYDRINPRRAAMFEDDPRNLTAPHDLGMRTVHVAPTKISAPHIHCHTNNLARFLSGLG